eukprot:2964530-Alexandrium_andersonii.AAC.1
MRLRRVRQASARHAVLRKAPCARIWAPRGLTKGQEQTQRAVRHYRTDSITKWLSEDDGGMRRQGETPGDGDYAGGGR